jgi:hypothetical protein
LIVEVKGTSFNGSLINHQNEAAIRRAFMLITLKDFSHQAPCFMTLDHECQTVVDLMHDGKLPLRWNNFEFGTWYALR